MRIPLQLLIVALLLTTSTAARSQSETIIYLHGYIIELEGIQPVHEKFGLYDFNGIVAALGSNGATVIADVRPGETDVNVYAGEVADNIEGLIASGVDPNGITVVGFSKGGAIAIIVSNMLARSDVNFVFLAACSEWISSYPDLTFSGNILSVYEKTDGLAGSCKRLARRGDAVSSFHEIRLKTRKEHGAFYLPRSEWIEPLLEWVGDR